MKQKQTQYDRVKARAERLFGQVSRITDQYNAAVDEYQRMQRVRHALPGATISFRTGRGDNRRTVRGELLGLKQAEEGHYVLRVLVGEGFDAETVQVNEADAAVYPEQEEPTDGQES